MVPWILEQSWPNPGWPGAVEESHKLKLTPENPSPFNTSFFISSALLITQERVTSFHKRPFTQPLIIFQNFSVTNITLPVFQTQHIRPTCL